MFPRTGSQAGSSSTGFSAEVAATQGCVTDSDMEFTGSVDGGRPGLESLFFSPNACWRKSDISCMSQAWVFLFVGKGDLLPCSPASLLVLIVILISKRVIGAEAWPFFRRRVFWLCGPCSAPWILQWWEITFFFSAFSFECSKGFTEL